MMTMMMMIPETCQFSGTGTCRLGVKTQISTPMPALKVLTEDETVAGMNGLPRVSRWRKVCHGVSEVPAVP